MMDRKDILVNNIPCAVTRIRYEDGLVVEYANDSFYELIKLSREDFLQEYSNHYEQIILYQDWKKVQKVIERAIREKKPIEIEYRANTGHQDYEWRVMKAEVLEESNGSPVLQCAISDVTDMKLTQEELEKEREKLRTVIKMSGDMIFEYDIATDHMIYTNTGDDVLFSREITHNYTKSLSDIIKEEDAEVGNHLAETLRSGREHFVMELRRMGTDNRYHWVSVTGKTFYDKEGKPEKVIGKIRNIDEQKRKEKELQDKSQKDSLTGLYNHMTAKNMSARKIAQMNPGEVSYLIVCDIDNFKSLNDTNGHMFGDAVICSFADGMCQLLPDAIKGRIGGDEFLIYVENIERAVVEERMVQLNALLSDRYDDVKAGIKISCSIGVVEIDGTEKDYNVLFQKADNALYVVKNQGKGSYLFVDSHTDIEAHHNSYLQSAHNRDTSERKDTLIRNDDELVLFCVELLENVSDITTALKMICERTCKFFDLDDMVCIEHDDEEKHILYQWNKKEKKEYAQRMYQDGVYEWDLLFGRTDKQGVLTYNEMQTREIETEEAKAVMLVFSKEIRDYQGSIVFTDRRKDRDWERERETLVRISNQIFNRLRLLRIGEQESKEIERKLNYDALTGLPVYNRFVTLAEDAISRNPAGLFCVYSDFSNFQYLNEMYGYEEGDSVIRRFARALEEYEKGIAFCRVTSDHFLGLIRANDLEEANQSYLDYTWFFAEAINQEYEQCNVVIASGLYEIKNPDIKIATMMDNANEARKKCKEQKVATAVVAYTQEIKQEAEATKSIVANIVTAFNNKEFYAYLQPKVSLKTGKVVGAEALVRWIKPDGTIIMPGQFIEISERNGYITKIDFAVLDCVMEYLKEAIDIGEEVVPISVNFSRRHNEFGRFVPSVIRRLEENAVPSSLLEAELTESVFLSDLDRLSNNIEALRTRGIEVSVDDFGSGYSSLNLLSRVSVDTVKLDRQFLQNTLNSANGDNALIVIKYLIQMLKHLGFKVLAEGVETREQLEMLKSADCDIVQGFYYAKPMPIAEFRKFLKEFNKEEV